VAVAASFVHALLELLADLEERQALGLHGDRRAGARVAALVGAVLPDLEAAKASDLDALAPTQRLLHRVEDHVDEELCPTLGHLLYIAQHVDEIRLRHRCVTPARAQNVSKYGTLTLRVHAITNN